MLFRCRDCVGYVFGGGGGVGGGVRERLTTRAVRFSKFILEYNNVQTADLLSPGKCLLLLHTETVAAE